MREDENMVRNIQSIWSKYGLAESPFRDITILNNLLCQYYFGSFPLSKVYLI
jgi:hypothetical protein